MKQLAKIAALFAIAGAAHAEQVFVSDKLVVSVYADANQESEKLTTLESGDAVELIEKAEGYARIKLADGREGWIRSSYLSTQMPAVLRLKQLENERSPAPAAAAPSAAMIEEIKQLKEQNGALHGEIAATSRGGLIDTVGGTHVTAILFECWQMLSCNPAGKVKNRHRERAIPSTNFRVQIAALSQTLCT